MSLTHANDLQVEGKLTRIVGMALEAVGCRLPIGHYCKIAHPRGIPIYAEVIGFDGHTTYLMSTENTQGLMPGARILPLQYKSEVPVDNQLLGRVIDGAGQPLDHQAYPACDTLYPLQAQPLNPLDRAPINTPLDVGIRAINALTTIGRGQRVGLFAGSGVGKSVLLGMMTQMSEADVCVIGLIGERGREVKEFIDHTLGQAGMQRSVIVAAPSDTSPLMRLHGAWRATAIAEYFRDQGKHVLLILDSLTRFAHAAREVGITVGEPPASKGYTPSVFAKLSNLVERAGLGGPKGGSITAFYTVLVEGDDHNDPIADAARSFLDGHIVLSRELANQGHYPAIDIESSVSRVMPHVVPSDHLRSATQFKQLYSAYAQNKDLINIGAYVAGSDPMIDRAIACKSGMLSFLQQDLNQASDIASSLEHLNHLITHTAATHESQAAAA